MKNQIIEKWDEILEFLRTEFGITKISFNTWLKNLKIKDVSDGIAYIIVEDDNIKANMTSFIQDRYGMFIRNAIAEITDIELNVKIISDIDIPEEKKIPNTKITNPVNQSLSLNPDYTFDNYVVSKNNSFAHATALKVAEAPGEYYNPLYIYGDAGLGKTHLMHSIGHFIIENSPSLKVMYVTSEMFTNDLIDSIRHGKITPAAFREKYRNIDVLLIDDIQFIIGKESTQEEFFHTFNALYEAKKQIVISSDKPPKDFNTLEERLRSRFGWGLIVDLTSPDFETKIAILKKKVELKMAESGNFHIDDEVLAYIARNVNTNIRALEGALTKIIAMSKIKRTPANMELAEYALRDIIFPNQKKVITPEFIIEVVAEHFQFTVSELLSTKRDKNISIPRQIAMYLSKKYTNATTTDLGRIFSRDHSTVLHGIDNIEKKLPSDSGISSKVDILIKKINPEE